MLVPGEVYKMSGLASWVKPNISDLTWTPDGTTLAVASDLDISLYDIATRQVIRTLYPEIPGITDIDFSTNGIWMVSGSRSGDEESGYRSALELWLGPDWKPLGVLYGIGQGLSKLTFSPDSQYLFTAYASPNYQDNYVDTWNTITWEITSTLDTGTVLDIGVSRDGVLLASTPDRYAIRVWDQNEGLWLYKIHTSFTGAVNTIAFSPTSLVLASGHYDGMIRLWDMLTGEMQLEMDAGGVVQSLAFSPDGALLASGNSYENGLVQIWNAQTGILLRVLEGHNNGVSNLEFSPDGRLLASASYDGSLWLWGIRP